MERPRKQRERMAYIGFASILTLGGAACSIESSESPENQTVEIEDTDIGDAIRDNISTVEYYRIGTVEAYGGKVRDAASEIGYYEYVDKEGRTHICDIATNARGGKQGVGLSCNIEPPAEDR